MIRTPMIFARIVASPLLTSVLICAGVGLSPVRALADSEFRIHGGTKVEPGAWPYVVALEAAGHLCTGTLISPTLILTAAHCFGNMTDSDSVGVYLGDEVGAHENMKSVRWGIDREFCGKADCEDESHDFAFVEIDTPIDVQNYPQPITDQQEWDNLMQVDAELMLVGYGQDEAGLSGIKRQVSTTISGFTPLGLQFLAGGDGKDSCQGDSGGPAFIKVSSDEWRLAGVLSSGSTPCGRGGYYGVPISAMPWLTELTDYRPQSGSCLSSDCLDTVPGSDEDGCGIVRRTRTGDIAVFSVILVGCLHRRRRKASTSTGSLPPEPNYLG